jgi:hypothetical protein
MTLSRTTTYRERPVLVESMHTSTGLDP